MSKYDDQWYYITFRLGDGKLNAIKFIRSVFNLGIVESKEYIDTIWEEARQKAAASWSYDREHEESLRIMVLDTGDLAEVCKLQELAAQCHIQWDIRSEFHHQASYLHTVDVDL